MKWTQLISSRDCLHTVVYEWRGKVTAFEGKWTVIIGDVEVRRGGSKRWQRNPGQVRRNRHVIRWLD